MGKGKFEISKILEEKRCNKNNLKAIFAVKKDINKIKIC
jgi:hypothetical protein